MEYEIYHYGVKGMKWGVRRYQRKDGSLTPAGKKRLAKSIQKQYPKRSTNSEYIKFTHDIADELNANYKQRLGRHVDAIKAAKKQRDKVFSLDNKYYTSDEAIKDRKRAYDETFEWFKKNDPDSLSAMISKNNGSRDGLEKYHDFDTTMDGYLDRAYSEGLTRVYRKHGLSDNAWNEASDAYSKVLTEATNDIVGRYGNMKLPKESSWEQTKKVESVIRNTLIDIAWRDEETAKYRVK